MLMRLSAIRPRPTQRFMPASPLQRQWLRPCRRLTTPMRPSQPVRHFCPFRNQRFFCSRRRAALLVERLGMHTRLTPLALASFILGGVEARVRRHQTRRATQHGFMRFDGWDQERSVVGALLVYLVVDDFDRLASHAHRPIDRVDRDVNARPLGSQSCVRRCWLLRGDAGHWQTEDRLFARCGGRCL